MAVATSNQKHGPPSDKMTNNTIVNETINLCKLNDEVSQGNKNSGANDNKKGGHVVDHDVHIHYQSTKVMAKHNYHHNYASNFRFPKPKAGFNIGDSPIVIVSPHITFKPSPQPSPAPSPVDAA